MGMSVTEPQWHQGALRSPLRYALDPPGNLSQRLNRWGMGGTVYVTPHPAVYQGRRRLAIICSSTYRTPPHWGHRQAVESKPGTVHRLNHCSPSSLMCRRAWPRRSSHPVRQAGVLYWPYSVTRTLSVSVWVLTRGISHGVTVAAAVLLFWGWLVACNVFFGTVFILSFGGV